MDVTEIESEVREIIAKSHGCGKRCSDYDEECVEVSNPMGCFMGSGAVQIGLADGYCPLIHNPN